MLKLEEIFDTSEIENRLESMSKSLNLPLNNILYLQAMTHRSFVYGEASVAVEDNERLEFLGDSVANMFVTQALYSQNLQWAEGELSQAKSILVSSKVFSKLALHFNLNEHIILSEGEFKAQANLRENVLEDAFEAFIGALYLDKGIEKVFDFLEKKFQPKFSEFLSDSQLLNGKSLLMEHCQKNSWPLPEYKVLNEYGLEHDKTFEIAVFIGSKELATGKGPSKKSVQKEIALSAYQWIVEHPEFNGQ